jgi:hypothetical protein
LLNKNFFVKKFVWHLFAGESHQVVKITVTFLTLSLPLLKFQGNHLTKYSNPSVFNAIIRRKYVPAPTFLASDLSTIDYSTTNFRSHHSSDITGLQQLENILLCTPLEVKKTTKCSRPQRK